MTDKEISDPAENSAEETPESPGAAAEVEAQEETLEGTPPGTVASPYSSAGAAFTAWFNDRVRRLPNPTVRLGTKTATVVELHPDGRLEVSLHASAGEAEQQFVSFDSQYLDQLLLKFAAQGA